jgi:hypothetical protein
MRKAASLVSLCFALVLCASTGHVVAVVHGRRILSTEIAPSGTEADAKRAALAPVEYEQWRIAEARNRLQERIWCELAVDYLKKRHLRPSAAQIDSYKPSVGTQVCSPVAALSSEILDKSILRKYGGRTVERGSRLIPVEARQKYLKEIATSHDVQIADPAYMGVLSEAQSDKYSVLNLSDEQVRIDCANGARFVIHRRPDGRWSEEVRVRAGAERVYANATQAASERCSDVP